MTGNPDGPSYGLRTRLDGGLEGAAAAGGAVEVFGMVYGVELDEIEAVYLQAFDGGPDLAPSGVLLAFAGLGGKEGKISSRISGIQRP